MLRSSRACRDGAESGLGEARGAQQGPEGQHRGTGAGTELHWAPAGPGFTTRKEGNCQEVPFLERGRCLFKGESQRIPSESQFLGNAGLSNLMVKRSLRHVGKVQCPAKCSFLKLPQQDYTPHLDIHIPVCRLFLGCGAARAPCSVSPNLI